LDKAVALGCAGALNSLGVIYESGGFGVNKDAKQAVKCFRQAAEKGDDQGQMNLGRMYQDGVGVERDLVSAYQWFYLAAQSGNGIARHYLLELDGSSPLSAGSLLSKSQIDEAIRRAHAFKVSSAQIPSK